MLTVYGYTFEENGRYDNIKSAVPIGEFYLHGSLDEKNKYDLCGITEMPTEGIHECTVYLNNGDSYKAKLFAWIPRKWEKFNRIRGLIVEVNDTEYLKDAEMKYKKKIENF